MKEHLNIIYPLFVMVLLPATVVLMIFIFRVKAVRDGNLRVQHFALHTTEGTSPLLTKLTHNLANQFEMPVLFYTVCVLAVAIPVVDERLVLLGWCYVASRYLHSLIHISYNKVLHRVAVFFVSNVILIIMWFRLMLQL